MSIASRLVGGLVKITKSPKRPPRGDMRDNIDETQQIARMLAWARSRGQASIAVFDQRAESKLRTAGWTGAVEYVDVREYLPKFIAADIAAGLEADL